MAGAFGARSTTDEVLEGIDLSGRRVLVTGVSAGLGVETARALVSHGAHAIGERGDGGRKVSTAFIDAVRHGYAGEVITCGR